MDHFVLVFHLSSTGRECMESGKPGYAALCTIVETSLSISISDPAILHDIFGAGVSRMLAPVLDRQQGGRVQMRVVQATPVRDRLVSRTSQSNARLRLLRYQTKLGQTASTAPQLARLEYVVWVRFGTCSAQLPGLPVRSRDQYRVKQSTRSVLQRLSTLGQTIYLKLLDQLSLITLLLGDSSSSDRHDHDQELPGGRGLQRSQGIVRDPILGFWYYPES